MPANLPDFIVNKIFVKDSLVRQGNGYTFTLNNTFAPVVVFGISIQADGKLISGEQVSINNPGQVIYSCDQISAQNPFPFSINIPYQVVVSNLPIPQKNITLFVDTRDTGSAILSINLKAGNSPIFSKFKFSLPGLFLPALKAEVKLLPDQVLGEINPNIYGHFIEHLERCIYGGVFSDDGSEIRRDVFNLIKPLNIPILRYPGGNFASGYHWEDGIGDPVDRLERFDQAWSAAESNRVGTDEYMDLVQKLGAQPFLVVNDGSGTPDEAARWVAYCNAVKGEQAERRARNGHPEPYNVKIWGIGNEVWGRWQIGTTTAETYARRLAKFAAAMKQADPSIQIVAVGNTIRNDDVDDPGRLWNQVVLREAGEYFDYLSFHLYQPDQDGWSDDQDPDELYYSVCAAANEAERMIVRLGKCIEIESPLKKIGIALDEWNLWLTPPNSAGSMHQLIYTMRDALYCAAMLNVFHRQSGFLSMANIAQLVNVLPMIVTNNDRAVTTPMYWPFWMYTCMQHKVIQTEISVNSFTSLSLGQNIPAEKDVPYLDLSATMSNDSRNFGISLINRHPKRKMNVHISMKDIQNYFIERVYVLSSSNPLAANTFEQPENVIAKEKMVGKITNGKLIVSLPACSVSVLNLLKKD